MAFNFQLDNIEQKLRECHQGSSGKTVFTQGYGT